ncbi:hypothetical protein, partial [Klebsiella pneumoniae]|uniref:hypothetical protein n=1 Tax=Klebsiella pneumoniae TaxID=573 RepID=UPI003EDFB9A5
VSGDITVTLDAASFAGLNNTDLAAFGTAGVTKLSISGGTLSLSISQAHALGTVGFDATNVITLTDTGAALAALTPASLASLA